MEKTGSQAERVIAIISLMDSAEKAFQSTKPFGEYSRFGKDLLDELKIAEKSNNVRHIIALEKLIVGLEIAKYRQADPSRMPSLNAASVDLEVMSKGIEFVQKHTSYKDMNQACHPKKKENGVPVDDTHTSMKSHITRIGNDIRGKATIPEKNIFRQRRKNMRLARELYIGLQQKALGIEPKEKNKGLKDSKSYKEFVFYLLVLLFLF